MTSNTTSKDNTPCPTQWLTRPGRPEEVTHLIGLDTQPLAPLRAGQQLWVLVPPSAQGTAEPQRPLACLQVSRGIGMEVPRAWYRLGWVVHAAAELSLFRQQRTLMLGNDLTGAHELGGWGVDPQASAPPTSEAWLQLVQQAVQAAMLEAPASSAPWIAELPGVRDAAGRSPFWQGLGRHFCTHDLDAALQAWGPGWEVHAAALLPRHLLYASFLPPAAQGCMGQAAAAAAALQQALAQAGFGWREHVRISDAGPVLERWVT
jgi:arginine N-succinyltransferase